MMYSPCWTFGRTNWYKVVKILHQFVIRWNQSPDRENVDSILLRNHCTVWTNEECLKRLVTAELKLSQPAVSHNSTDGQAAGPSDGSWRECWWVFPVNQCSGLSPEFVTFFCSGRRQKQTHVGQTVSSPLSKPVSRLRTSTIRDLLFILFLSTFVDNTTENKFSLRLNCWRCGI